MKARGRAFFVMDLARELKMTKWQLLHSMDAMELMEWEAYFREVNTPRPKKQSKEELEGALKNFMTSKGRKKRAIPTR